MAQKSWRRHLAGLGSLICLLLFVGATNVHALKSQNQRFSFRFKNCSVIHALNRISNDAGIEIFVNDDFGKQVVNKAYQDRQVDDIIIDLFQSENYAVTWGYQDKKLVYVHILVVEKAAQGRSDLVNVKELNRANKKDPSTTAKNDANSKGARSASANTIAAINVPNTVTPESPMHDFQENGRENNGEMPFGYGSKNNKHASTNSAQIQDASGSVEAVSQTEPESLHENPVIVPEKRGGLEPPPMPPGFSR